MKTHVRAPTHTHTWFMVVCTNGDLRLAGGNVINEGRIEICINNVWGTICDDYWSDADANVACRKLGYSRFSRFDKRDVPQ